MWETAYWELLKRLSQILTSIGICYISSLPKFGHQIFSCLFIRYFVPTKIYPVLSLCQKHEFCNKVGLNDFYPLLRHLRPSLIYICVKKITQAWCLHHLKLWQNIVKHNFGRKYKIGRIWESRSSKNAFNAHNSTPSLNYQHLHYLLILNCYNKVIYNDFSVLIFDSASLNLFDKSFSSLFL